MSARNDIEVAKPDMGQLRERVELARVTFVDMVSARSHSEASLGSNGRVA